MRKPDVNVQEVTCSETGKPMPKIPLWMAGMKVKFVSDEARQKHSSATGIADIEPIRKSLSGTGELDELKDFDVVGTVIEPEADFDDLEAEPDEMVEEDYDAEP
jgi:hypothetical protein